MPNLSSGGRFGRLAVFSLMYLAQGLPWGFITVGFGVLLTDMGFDNTAIGTAVGLAYLPWSFKILWGPMLDAVPQLRMGRRRPFVIVAQLLMGVTMAALAGVDPKVSFPLVTGLLFLNNVFASLQDVAIDALAVDLLKDDERGRANALMWAGKSLGVAIGGGGGTVVAKYAGWDALFFGIAALLWAVMAVAVLVRERPSSPEDRPVDRSLLKLGWFLIPFAAIGTVMYGLSVLEVRLGEHPLAPLVAVAQPFAAVGGALLAWPLVDRTGFRALRETFSFPAPWWGVLVGVLTPAGYALVGTPTVKLLRGELRFTEEQIATLAGVVDPIAGVVGALIGGFLADRYGARASIGAWMGVIAAVLGGFALAEPWWPSFTFQVVFTAVFGMSISAYNAATLGLYMTMSNPRIGATHFATYMAATNLTYAWTAPLGGMIADRYSYAPLYATAAVLQVLAIALIWPLDPEAAASRYRHEGAAG